MDRNSIIGLLLIGGILIGWLFISKPSAKELALQQHVKDSVEQYEQTQKSAQAANKALANNNATGNTAIGDSTAPGNDSILNWVKGQAYGDFAAAAAGENKVITIENELLKVNISTKGGRISSVELKNYKTFDGKPLLLFHPDSSSQNIQLPLASKIISTDSLYFVPEGATFSVKGAESKSISLRLYAGDKAKYLEYTYSLTGNDYMMGFRVNAVGLQNIINAVSSNLVLNWQMKTPSQEQAHQSQSRASTIYFQYPEETADKISEGSEDKKSFEKTVKWVGFKQQFFTSVLIADNTFGQQGEIETKMEKNSKNYIKDYRASLSIPYKHGAAESFGMRMYFGPNHYQTLKKYDIGLERQINLGWKIFGWVNRFLVIPIFNFLNGFNLNYGVIILILTIIIKLLLLPIAYRTVLSSAKMRVLKPELDELNAKFKDGDAMKKQQATMALYKQAGVNPMAGCIPVLLQMPILIALFNFFPASIELRQQGFLWAHDLSTYDSIYNFGFNVPWYGDHISLFALLMTISTLLYTWSNSQLMGTSNQMPGMKWMMYLMPILFLGFMNSYSAGLSWYYFLANMFTFGQTWVMQKFVIDHDALHKKIQANKTKPVKQNKFQERLEAMAKEAQNRQKK